jgi:hypothetical protein
MRAIPAALIFSLLLSAPNGLTGAPEQIGQFLLSETIFLEDRPPASVDQE